MWKTIRTVNLILACWKASSCRIVCVIAVKAYLDAGYTLNNGTGKSGMRCPRTLKNMKNVHKLELEARERANEH